MRLIVSSLLTCSIAFITVASHAEEANPNAPVRTTKELQAVFNTVSSDITKIIDGKRKENPEVQGLIEYKVTVEADGVVSEVLVDKSTIKDAKMEDAILKLIKKLNFGTPSGRSEKVTFNFPIDIPHKDAKPATPPMKVETKPVKI
jgi:hypothetical protein